MSKSFPAISTIFTNLDEVLIDGLRLNCKAVVISNDPDLHEGAHRQFRLAGYGSSCIWKVFDMHLGQVIPQDWMSRTPPSEGWPIFDWVPSITEQGREYQTRRGVLRVAPMYSNQTWMDLELVATYPGTRDLGISVTTIKGTWTPGASSDWSVHCHRIGTHVFDSAMKAVEATAADGHPPMNALVAIAGQPQQLRQLLDETGSQL